MQVWHRIMLAIAVTVGLAPAFSAAEPIMIKFNKEDELKTSLRWIDLRPNTIRPTALAAASIPGTAAAPAKATNLRGEPAVNHAETAVGKLLFVKPSGEAGSCTATFIGGNHVLLTAARCIMSTAGKQNRDFVFVSAYGSVAQQIYPINCVALPGEWVRLAEPEAWAHNYAFLHTARASTFGGLGVTNALVPKRLTRVGYADAVARGARLQLSASGAYMARGGLVGTVYDPLAAGSSGNPWIRGSIVYSLSSHYDPALPGILLGPRLTGATMQLLARVREEC